MKTDPEKLLNSLTGLIMARQRELELESHFPGADPDRMDSKITTLKRHVAKLRAIRQEIEDILAEPVS